MTDHSSPVNAVLDREERYLLEHFDADCGIMPGDVEGSFHRIREAFSIRAQPAFHGAVELSPEEFDAMEKTMLEPAEPTEAAVRGAALLESLYGPKRPAQQTASPENAVWDFAKAILHGDDEHRGWLLEAAAAFEAGKPIPAPRGSGIPAQSTRDAVIEEVVHLIQKRFLVGWTISPTGLAREDEANDILEAVKALSFTSPESRSMTTQEQKVAMMNARSAALTPEGELAIARIRLEYMEAKFGKIDWDATDRGQP